MNEPELLPSPALRADFYNALMESQYWAAERMLAHQRQRLGILLRHARSEVPFYRDRLSAVFRANGDVEWDAWSRLPILRRSELLEHRGAMQSASMPRGSGTRYTALTSGSTGPHVTTTHNTLANFAGYAANWRGHTWHNVDWSQGHCLWAGDSATEAQWPEGFDQGIWGPPWDAAARRGKSYRVNRHTTDANVLEFLKRRQIAYFAGRGKSCQALAFAAEAAHVQLELAGLLGYSTVITPGEREDCRRAFGCEISSLYSSKEGLTLAYQCSSGLHFHVNSETVLLEVLDDDGRPVEPGEIGRVVITPLYSLAQPLIRYEQGDLAIAGLPCACGRSLPVLSSIVGRTYQLFVLPNGERVSPMMPDSFRKNIGARYWQFAQVGPLHVEVRYVADPAVGARDETEIVEFMRQRTDPDLIVSFREVPDLVRLDGGKFMEYVNEWSADSPASHRD